jgi:hypothetical protein
MERDQLRELHYITPIGNVSSILQHGLLSHVSAARLKPASVAMQEIQRRRSPVMIPGGRRLHEYVNLYICGRNPMLYKLRHHRDQLCVLSVSPDVLDLAGAVIADCNASSNYVRFSAAPAGLQLVNRELTFAEFWTDDDPIVSYRKKSAKCAEVLVPNRVVPRYLLAVYVWNDAVGQQLRQVIGALRLEVDRHLFFA